MSGTKESEGEGGDSRPKPTYSTRVFKKAAPNNKITAYLGRRDFFDDGEKVDVVDGVVLVDKDYLNRETGWKVFVHLLAAFRYGREDLESLVGLVYKKDIYSKYVQVYPPLEDASKKITRLQDRLIKKLGDSAHPFLFELPRHLAPSISIQPAANENGKVKPCGVDYQLSAFVAFSSDEKPDKKNSVRMAIKKLNLMTDSHRKQPSIDLKKEFVLSNYPVCIEARLDKELYNHGEDIKLFLNIENRSSKTLKAVAIEIKQYADVTTGGINATYKSVVALVDSEVGFPVNPSSHMSQTYSLLPSIDCNTRHQETKRGSALDGQYKVGDSNLASTSVLGEAPTLEIKEAQAIVIQYKLKAKLTVVRGTDIKFDLPFRLTHRRPSEPVFVRKSGNEGAAPQYVTVTQTEAANLMTSMSEYTTVKKSSSAQATGRETSEERKTTETTGRVSAPPAAASTTVQPTTRAGAGSAPPAAQPAAQPAGANLLIDLMDFNAAPAAKAEPQLQELASPQSQPIYSQPMKGHNAFAQQPAQSNVFGQPAAQPMQQAYGQPMQQQQQPFMAAAPQAQPFAMGNMNPFGGAVQAQQQQQPFMGQQVNPMYGGGMMMQQQPVAASNPFAAPMMGQQQQQVMPQMQQAFGQPAAAQNFMLQQQPAQQAAAPFAPNFGSALGAAKPTGGAPKSEEDLFFEEFVSMRLDGNDA